MPHSHDNPPPVHGSNQDLAAWFCTEHRLHQALVWHQYVARKGNVTSVDHVFWLDDEIWAILCDDVGRLGDDKLRTMIAQPEATDPLSIECLLRLHKPLIGDVHRAAATIATNISWQLPKPPSRLISAPMYSIVIPTR